MYYFVTFVAVIFGVALAIYNLKRKRKREDERLKQVIKQAIEETKKND